MKNKISWEKPNYEQEYQKVLGKEIDELCLTNSTGSGDIRIEKNKYGRKITFVVYRVEKVGTLIEGIDTLTRERAIQELKELLKEDSHETN